MTKQSINDKDISIMNNKSDNEPKKKRFKDLSIVLPMSSQVSLDNIAPPLMSRPTNILPSLWSPNNIEPVPMLQASNILPPQIELNNQRLPELLRNTNM
jgi:hypothetical protein